MKTAVVLFADSPSLNRQTGEINAMLSNLKTNFSNAELWLFYKDAQPEIFPEIHFAPLYGALADGTLADKALSIIRLVAMEHEHVSESYLQWLQHLMDQYPMELLVFPSDGLGAELATRLAFRLNGSSCLQVEGLDLTSQKPKVKKPVYGNNLTAEFVLEYPPYCLSVAKQACAPAKMIPGESIKKEIFPLHKPGFDWVKEMVMIPDKPDTGLADSDLVLILGQGVKSKETMDVLQGIANTIGAQLGASRPVVMNAWIDMNRLIGASGLIISPKICIAAGVSGTGVFSMGIKCSEFIVAINIDSKAPIFQIADIGIVGDLQDVLCELEKIIKAEKDMPGSAESRIETK